MKLCRVTEFIKDTLSSETLAAISNRANKLIITQSSYRQNLGTSLCFSHHHLPSSPSSLANIWKIESTEIINEPMKAKIETGTETDSFIICCWEEVILLYNGVDFDRCIHSER